VLLPVIDERTADAWIERAQLVTARRLADEVMWSRMACDAGVLPQPDPPRLGGRLEGDLRRLVQFCGRPGGARTAEPARTPALADVEIRFRAPASVAGLFRAAIEARREPGEPVWAGLLRLLEDVRAFWLSVPRHRNPIFERDGWRCVVPACSSRRSLQDHHVVFRSRGGGGERDNRVAVCASHHQHGIHREVLRATGKAGSGLTWELGGSRNGEPLLRVAGHGEVYVSTDRRGDDYVTFEKYAEAV
jgi:hypothetical protein